MEGNATSPDKGIAIRAGSLLFMQCFIIPGNSLILIAISSFETRTVSDMLIACLALIDLLNGIGPVNISISMYYSHPKGFLGLENVYWLCSLYTWMSCLLRLMGCFTATFMSIDRYVAIVIPFHYRTKATPKLVCLIVLVFFILSVLIALLPILGAADINVFVPMCSFNFTGGFASLIAVLGYIQALIVIVCYVCVMLEINAFLSRQTMLKATQLRASFTTSKSRLSWKRDRIGVEEATQSSRLKSFLTRKRSSVSPLIEEAEMVGPSSNQTPSSSQSEKSKDGQVRCHGERSQSLTPLSEDNQTSKEKQTRVQGDRSSSLTSQTSRRSSMTISQSAKTKRSKSLSPKLSMNGSVINEHTEHVGPSIQEARAEEAQNEAKVQSSLRDFKKNHSTWKQSRKLAIVMGIVVMLFYISWLPIVAIITKSLLSKSTSPAMHFAAARMSLMSSMVNFLVYGAMLKQYRIAYRVICKKIFCLREQAVQPTRVDQNPKPRRKKWFKSSSEKQNENLNGTAKRVRFKRTMNAVSPGVHTEKAKAGAYKAA